MLSLDLRSEWMGRVVSQLSTSPFGGATPTNVVGSFLHQDGRVTRETITIVASSCPRTTLADAPAKERILAFAKTLCRELGQESIFVGWGDQSYCVSENFELASVPVTRFEDLPAKERPKLLTMGWGGIDSPDKLLQVLSLDGWREPESVKVMESDGLRALAVRKGLGEAKERTAWKWTPKGASFGDLVTRYKELKSATMGPKPGDLVFFQESAETISFGLCTAKKLVGHRELRLSHGSLTPVTRELLGAILHRDWSTLEELLAQKSLEKRFFPELRRLRAAVEGDIRVSMGLRRELKSKKRNHSTEDLESDGEKVTRKHGPGDKDREAFGHSVLFVGRMMFLRFLVEKGWIPGGLDGLVRAHERLGRRFYKEYLLPLWFEVLNQAPEKRSETIKASFPDYPYLNGGLFQLRGREATFDLGVERFDPESDGSFLALFQKYQFSLNEYGGSDETVRIDPSFFGKALESFNSEADKKTDGVHYTPKPIALALAVEGIVERVAGLTRVERAKIESLLRDEVSLSPSEAARVLKALRGLRIVDPAVGSGVLLWASLEVLMTLDCACEGILSGGARYERGSFKWGKQCRHYVCNSLFGVDVSEEAVELARLRLWLAVAMSEDQPALLPDLELNIFRGDSLKLTATPVGKSKATQMSLGLDEETALKNQLAKLTGQYANAGEERPQAQREILERVQAIRRKLQALGATDATREFVFDWDLAFPQVFSAVADGEDDASKRGFDLVIANPPYVSVQNVKEDYPATWTTIQDGSADLSFAFVELGLKRLAAPNGGQLAFIQPNFRHHDAGAPLRRMLTGGDSTVPTRLRLWVDFDDEQVFATATNYVALLFAERLERPEPPRPFRYSNPKRDAIAGTTNARVKPEQGWKAASELGDIGWLRPGDGTHEHAPVDAWLTLPVDLVTRVHAASNATKRRLEDVADIDVGVQTSADKVFLFKEVLERKGKVWRVTSQLLKKPVDIEKAMLRPCIKGSSSSEHFLLYPYDRQGRLLDEATLERKFPLAWTYLSANKRALERREKGAFKGAHWYRFGRKQGFEACSNPKLIVPALLCDPPVVHVDEKGEFTYTASGKGGGGAWAIRPKTGSGLTLDELAAVLKSARAWDHARVYGSPQQGGWRGVDRDVLGKLPV